jgi:hypothetical protein
MPRRGITEADQYGMAGFYYFSPENTTAWRIKNYGFVVMFWPLNAIDRALGFGRCPGAEPLWGVSK